MPLRHVLLSVGAFSALAATSLTAGHRAAPTALPLAAKSVDAPASARLEAREQVDDAIAAAVIGSVARQFDASDVVVQLGRVTVTPASIQDRQVDGEGRLRIGGQGDWISFRFAGLYDTTSAEVTYPRLQLGGGDRKPLEGGSELAGSLDRQVTAALGNEFRDQPVSWSRGEVQATDLGRYVRVEGSGVADFGAEGSTPAQVQGLYDAVARRWVRVHYELGPASEWTTGNAVASL